MHATPPSPSPTPRRSTRSILVLVSSVVLLAACAVAELPGLLAALPRLSPEEAEELARDVERARREFERVEGLTIENWAADG